MSHPLRVRGLKHWQPSIRHWRISSHPLRVRGLKLCSYSTFNRWISSHPLRVRGLKPEWVEVKKDSIRRILYGCVDWNRKLDQNDRACMQSHPLRVRGLKHKAKSYQTEKYVASFTGAWIETCCTPSALASEQSHPLRVRGLKHVIKKSL